MLLAAIRRRRPMSNVWHSELSGKDLKEICKRDHDGTTGNDPFTRSLIAHAFI